MPVTQNEAHSFRERKSDEMPLLNGRPFDFAQIPAEDKVKPDTNVFYIPFTGEIFLTHEYAKT